MDESTVQTFTADRVAHVRLTRPAARNALDRATADALRDAAAGLAELPELRCVVLSGEGEDFSVGGDIHKIRQQSCAETLALNQAVLDAVSAFEHLPVPTVAALQGNVLGGGLEVALGASIRIAAENATLGLPEVRLGLVPGSGGLARLPLLIGAGPAARMLLTGRIVRADEALRIGLVDEVVPADALAARASATAARIAANGPLAVRAIHALLRTQRQDRVDRALAAVAEGLPAVLTSADAAEGLAAFAERRTPQFRGD